MLGLRPHRIGDPAAQGLPRGPNCQRRALRDLIRELQGFLAQAIGSRQHIGESPRDGFCASDAPTRVEHHAGPLNPDQSRQRVRQSETGMNPEPYEIRRKSSLGRHYAKVGDQRQPESSTDRCALNCGYHRLLRREQPDGMLVERVHATGWDRGAMEVGASAKRLAFRRQHQCTARGLFIQGVESIGDIADQLNVEIIVWRAMNLHVGDMPVQANRHIRHDRSLVYTRSPYTESTMLKCLLLPILIAVAAVCQTPSATEDQSRAILDKSLKERNPDTRKQAVIALSLIGPRDPFLTQLEAMLDDKDVEVRLATIASLVDLKNARTGAALHKALNDDVPEVSFAAARALWGLKDPAGKESLLSILSGETKASSSFFSKQKREGLRMMHTPKTMFMFAVKTGAGLAPIPGLGAGVSSMQGLLTDPGVSGRATAALLLGQDKDQQTLAALRDALTDKDWSVRAAAVHSISLRNDSSLQRDIVPLLEDNKEPVRLRAAAGYLRLQSLRTNPRPERKKT
jgi:hypothetical protein